MATQIQSHVAEVLHQLGFEWQNTGGAPDSPIELKITESTVQKITQLKGKIFHVDGGGNVVHK